MRDHPFQIVPDFVGTDANSFDSTLLDPPVAASVTIDSRCEVVSPPIDFNSKRRCLAVEIEYVGSKRMLATEVEPVWAQPKDSPESDL